MKYEFPADHGLSQTTIENLVFKDGDSPALTDVQYSALAHGVGRGESLLVVSPTSTGKTQIGLWAISNSLQSNCNTVYLVTHRALAKQKFDDFKNLLLASHLDNNNSNLVIATGDYVQDLDGISPKEPLRSTLLVATYEKYLALLSASGVPTNMRNTVVICDEIQLLGDKHRGKSVEILLTFLKNAGWKQFLGLSAVLQNEDAINLSNWLEVPVLIESTREKHLKYECWTRDSIASSNSEFPEIIEEGIALPVGAECNILSVLKTLVQQNNPPLPVIVFCMKKPETYSLAQQYLNETNRSSTPQLSLAFDELPETTANSFLANSVASRVAIHTADLTDEEREIVEQKLLNRELDVVFATTTLAAGVNFPLGAAIFASWKRWDQSQKGYVPISASEFHNMAGRVGRMGFEHEQGKVIFLANTISDTRVAREYLNLGALPRLEPRVTPERFDQLVLQLVSSGLCNNQDEIEHLVCNTFSALREQDKNSKAFASWPEKLRHSTIELIEEGLLLKSSHGLTPTPVGKAIAQSGLMPQTCIYLLEYLVKKSEVLANCLPTIDSAGDTLKLSFLLYSACFSSPEFRGSKKSRFLPYPLENQYLFDASVYASDLIEPNWFADPAPINAAKISCDWIEGAELKSLEGMLENLSAGMLLEMRRNLVWVLQGMASILTAASDNRLPEILHPAILRSTGKLHLLAKLPRVITRLSLRLLEGLPDDVLWMMSLNKSGATFRITRSEVLALRSMNLATPEKVVLGSTEADVIRLTAFSKVKPSPQAKANWLRDACRNWKLDQRQKMASRHEIRAANCINLDLVKQYYATTGTQFEKVFESILTALNISHLKLDDKNAVGAPDYLLRLQDSPELIIELKSKENDKLVDYNKAVEVLSASEIHGYRESFCVTLCHPGVDPSVPMIIANCGRLSVVESCDLGEALLRLCEGALTQQQLWAWLTTPGQALIADLPFKDYTI